jgi:hypothetical protein
VNSAETSADRWRDLADRLAAHDIRYLTGGSDWEDRVSPYPWPELAPLATLLMDLARAPEARLRNALTSLFLRHPEYAPEAETVASGLAIDDPARRTLLLAILVASALQSEWSFSLDLYLPGRERIEAGHLATELALPSPSEDFGRPCLAAAAELSRRHDAFPFNYEAAWEDAAHRLLSQLRREARQHGA